MTDHLARAKDYITKGEDYYRKAAGEIIAARVDDPDLSFREIGRRLDRHHSWVKGLLDWHDGGGLATPFGGEELNAKTDRGKARRVLREGDDETVKEIMASLPAEAVERMVEKGTDRLVENARAKRAEHETESTTKDLMGDDRFDPAEYWADTLIIRLNRNARELTELQERAGGLLLGSMEKEEAFEYMQDTERRVAEARAAVQAQLRDELEV